MPGVISENAGWYVQGSAHPPPATAQLVASLLGLAALARLRFPHSKGAPKVDRFALLFLFKEAPFVGGGCAQLKN